MTDALVHSLLPYYLPIIPQSPLSEPLRQTALSTIVSFVEWVEFPTLLMEDAKLIKLLYNLIGMEELKTVACECLLPILSRKVRIILLSIKHMFFDYTMVVK